jgi:hypothetical protein
VLSRSLLLPSTSLLPLHRVSFDTGSRRRKLKKRASRARGDTFSVFSIFSEPHGSPLFIFSQSLYIFFNFQSLFFFLFFQSLTAVSATGLGCDAFFGFLISLIFVFFVLCCLFFRASRQPVLQDWGVTHFLHSKTLQTVGDMLNDHRLLEVSLS